MDLTVVIPTINRSSLKRAIDSTKGISKHLRVIVVGDSINGVDIKNENITVKLSNSTDSCSKRNLGLSISQTDFIIFLDDDDELNADVLKSINLREYINENCVGLVFNTILKKDGVQRQITKKRGEIRLKDILIRNCVGTTSSVILNRHFLKSEKIEFDARNLCRQDFDLWVAILNEGKYFEGIGQNGLIYWDQDKQDRISKQSNLKKLVSIMKMYYRHVKMNPLLIISIFNHVRYFVSMGLKR